MTEPKPTRWIAASAFWSFAEATFFFVVPDVILSAATVRCGFRAGVLAALAAAIAAAAGGLIIYLATANGLVDPFALFDHLPAVSAGMIARVREVFASEDWPLAMLAGSFSGVPYKLYAASAAAAGTPLAAFLLWSLPIRLARFALIVGAAALLRPLFLGWLGPRYALLPVALMWVAFYAVFWTRMPQ